MQLATLRNIYIVSYVTVSVSCSRQKINSLYYRNPATARSIEYQHFCLIIFQVLHCRMQTFDAIYDSIGFPDF